MSEAMDVVRRGHLGMHFGGGSCDLVEQRPFLADDSIGVVGLATGGCKTQASFGFAPRRLARRSPVVIRHKRQQLSVELFGHLHRQ